jgi:DNA gyrase/topoisomerase IV subunit B
VYNSCLETLTKFFAANKALARRICDRASELKNLKNEFVNNKKALRELKTASTSRSALPHKLAMAMQCKPEDRELYIIEGESARGSVLSARDSNFQEALALKGKILNVMREKKADRVFENEEVMNILKSIGFIPDLPDPISKLRVGKIILCADADVDGHHINSLILGCLYRFVPGVFQRNMVYVAKGAEYLAQTPSGNFYADTLDELKSKLPPKYHGYILHLKGWGEANADAFSDMAFNPRTRKLLKIKPFDKDGEIRFKALMQESISYREALLGLTR